MEKLKTHMEETEEFRQMQISPESLKRLRQFVKEERMDFSECLAVLLVEQDFVLDGSAELDRETLQRKIALFQRKKPKPFGQLVLACEKIFLDLVYFPLPKTKGESKFFFEDGYGMARSYGGNRTHEGIDIFGSSKERSYYPVVSMTDGIVEKIGWLPLGGYRIGIRSPGGGYFYYAHLSAYEKDFQVGDRVCAGEILGLMGDTGYGPEGTSGKFPVHLHLGIYITDHRGEEMSVNPYPILVLLENQTQEYQY